MSKEAEFCRHAFLVMIHSCAKDQENQDWSCISGVSVLQNVTLKMSSQSRKFEFKVFSIIHLNDHDLRCTGPISRDNTDNK